MIWCAPYLSLTSLTWFSFVSFVPLQCKMSMNGQRGECWCVNPHTGRAIPESPLVRGDPNCSQYLGGPEMEPPTMPLN